MPKADRDESLRILKKVDETLVKNWHGYEGFEELQEKLSRLRTILEEAGESDGTGALFKNSMDTMLWTSRITTFNFVG